MEDDSVVALSFTEDGSVVVLSFTEDGSVVVLSFTEDDSVGRAPRTGTSLRLNALHVLYPAPFVAGYRTCLPKIPTTGHARQSEFSCGRREIATVTSRSAALFPARE